MKVFDAIEAKRLGRVAPVTRFAHVDATIDMTAAAHRPDQFNWKYGIQLHCLFTGPITAQEQFHKKAKRLIAKELYGELVDDVYELLRLLSEEQYRSLDDPIMKLIKEMLHKVRGET